MDDHRGWGSLSCRRLEGALVFLLFMACGVMRLLASANLLPSAHNMMLRFVRLILPKSDRTLRNLLASCKRAYCIRTQREHVIEKWVFSGLPAGGRSARLIILGPDLKVVNDRRKPIFPYPTAVSVR